MNSGNNLRLGALLLLGAVACAGNPQSVGVYTPIPINRVFSDVERKVIELGYTVARSDQPSGQLIAERPLDPPQSGADKEELRIEIAPDASGVTRLQVSAARVVPASADRPTRRISSTARGSKDANAVVGMFMKVR
jgi:hypothetical protein